MKILFDQGTPVPLRDQLPGHLIDTVYERGWSQLNNGELLTVAEQSGYEVFLTTDQRLKYQQSLSNRMIAIIVLRSTSWPRIQHRVGEIQKAIDTITRGEYIEIDV
jgi:predicted nuclease of predicted toxin-antitoxin system